MVGPLERYPWYIRFFFWLQKRKYGKILSSSKIWARSPRLFFGVSAFYGAIDRKASPLSPQLRSLLMVYISQLNSCTFCIDLNTEIFRKLGEREEKLQQLQQCSALFSEKERAALAYAKALTNRDQTIPEGLTSQLEQHFSNDEIVELTALIAFQNCSNIFTNSPLIMLE